MTTRSLSVSAGPRNATPFLTCSCWRNRRFIRGKRRTIGSIPTIFIDLLTSPRAEFNQVFLGQRVFYYLIPLSADRIVEIAGHRYYFTSGSNNTPTHYDEVIAGLNTSLTAGNF